MSNFNNQQDTKNLADFSNIDINEIHLNSEAANDNQCSYDENGFFSNLDDFNLDKKLNIKILGVGGAGNNMITHMAKNSDLDPKMLYAINTDLEVLRKISAIPCSKVLIGKHTTSGYGSGSDPIVGKQAAEEDRQLIKQLLQGVDLLFIVSGMGKGTGTGASPVIAEVAKELGILTIAIVNIPSIKTEGKAIFDKGILGTNNLKRYVDGLATINNDKILANAIEDESLFNNFRKINQVISDTISNLIYTVSYPSDINVDFNDVKNFFKDKTNFQITNCEFESNENSKELLKAKIAATLFEDKLIGSKKAMLTLKLNPNVPSSFLNDVRQVMEEITENPNLELTYAVDYSSDISFAKISILVATNYFESLANEYAKEEVENTPIFNTPIVNTIEEVKEEAVVATPLTVEKPLPPPPVTSFVNNNSLKDDPQAFIDNMISEIDKISLEGINNQNPTTNTIAASFDKKYNLDEINTIEDDYNSLKEELAIARTNNIIKKATETQEFVNTITKNQANSINSTTLNKFVEKTLSLFKKNQDVKVND